MSRFDWAGKLTQWKLCKRLEFGHSDKWYMQKPEFVQEYKTHEILEDFEILGSIHCVVAANVLDCYILLSEFDF